MADETAISWTGHTWNPWRGCTKISPGCEHCYMFTAQEKRQRETGKFEMWNPEKVQRTGTWNDPLRWQKKLADTNRIELVFTCSWSDWFHTDADQWRNEAWDVVRRCPNLHFQILTKRPMRILKHLPADWGAGWGNVWLGTSIESPDYLWRADYLRQVPARVRFISAEPLLAPLSDLNLDGIHWLIVGGESGPGFRPMDHAWGRELLKKCREQVPPVAFFWKQSAAIRTEMGTKLDGREYKEYPIDISSGQPVPSHAESASE